MTMLSVRSRRTLLIAAAAVAAMAAAAFGGGGGSCGDGGREERNGRGGGAAYAVAAYDSSLGCGGRPCRAVKIGGQTWTAENLNYKPPKGNSWCYGDADSNCAKYGRLYDWNTAMGGAPSSSKNPSGARGVCPAGWHVPSNAEWKTLLDLVGVFENGVKNGINDAGDKLKSSTGWRYKHGDGADEYGFSAIAAGRRNDDGNFGGEGIEAAWWAATGCDGSEAYDWNMGTAYSSLTKKTRDKEAGLPVRCVKDK
ncbi:hypothetical protein R80B4_02808 [Fibrobacteres bacterium R8-0-B4]